MKLSPRNLAATLCLSVAILVDAEAETNNLRGNNSGPKCTTYKLPPGAALQTSAVFRSARIDQITSSTQCENIAGFVSGALGATFCSGDTFSIGAVPFLNEHDEEVGYYTRSGMRVPAFGDNPILVGNSFNSFVFENGDQLHFQSTDLAGSPDPLVSSIAGGTGEFIGASGEVTITNFLSGTEDNTFEVCLMPDWVLILGELKALLSP
mmetsp:Transcript_6062/g.13733  ORF Transcript_6062/g.13733 Transcript_6062/m.13733 type:complete len:208 (+) Transcript_6062:48-671(+)|eukprot:CAMPEP_0172319694 /NCGR_PEP_ID=MMETSP1058-20130122/38432_1 /TAXON_ID=83371 /ORGANISM="Detonula confervacea, Strain CCMP 353" /LENGTH=207 /DNA_ID=CAMNT_0013034803 /DNA_START=9 /DNA_END=632 /DNA_ORIENTATION=+